MTDLSHSEIYRSLRTCTPARSDSVRCNQHTCSNAEQNLKKKKKKKKKNRYVSFLVTSFSSYVFLLLAAQLNELMALQLAFSYFSKD